MLIRTNNDWRHDEEIHDGAEQFDKKLDERTLKDTGYQVTNEYRERDEDLPIFDGWGLPMHFCVDCGKNDVVPPVIDGVKRINPGVFHLDEKHPEIDLTVGDMIVYYVCHDCQVTEMWRRDLLLGVWEKKVYEESTQDRRWRLAVDWIKNAKLRGEQPTIRNRS